MEVYPQIMSLQLDSRPKIMAMVTITTKNMVTATKTTVNLSVGVLVYLDAQFDTSVRIDSIPSLLPYLIMVVVLTR